MNTTAKGKGILMGIFLVVIREMVRRIKSSKIRLGLFIKLSLRIGKEREKIVQIPPAMKGVARRGPLKRLKMFKSSW